MLYLALGGGQVEAPAQGGQGLVGAGAEAGAAAVLHHLSQQDDAIRVLPGCQEALQAQHLHRIVTLRSEHVVHFVGCRDEHPALLQVGRQGREWQDRWLCKRTCHDFTSSSEPIPMSKHEGHCNIQRGLGADTGCCRVGIQGVVLA